MDNCKKCVLCDADFGEFRDHFYNNHCGEVLKTTLDPGGYTCDTIMCNYWTKAHSQMQSHCQQMFHCSSDLKQLSLAKNSPELATQEKVDSEERIYGKVMRSTAGGKKDVVTPTPGPENKSPCPHCVIKFPTKADVEIHVKSMHPLEKKVMYVFGGEEKLSNIRLNIILQIHCTCFETGNLDCICWQYWH